MSSKLQVYAVYSITCSLRPVNFKCMLCCSINCSLRPVNFKCMLCTPLTVLFCKRLSLIYIWFINSVVCRDESITIIKFGKLTDMSGTNDAFNSSICSLEVSRIYKQQRPPFKRLDSSRKMSWVEGF